MFNDITTRFDLTNAGFEVFVMLGISFLLGFLYCYFRSQIEEADEE